MLFAIVDIETTGSFSNEDGITEIGVVITDGEKEVERFETLVDPQKHIPRFITGLTGITNEMVESAPTFEQIADKLFHLLDGKVFVAHNVNFDFKFIKYALERYGYSFQPKRLCTVRLSRKILPGLPSYSLGKLTRSLGIELTQAHRAMGDASATAELFHLLHDKGLDFIMHSLKANSKEATLPANLPKERFDLLPPAPGVYYFYNEKGKVIYIGKAKNLKKRVSSHFTGKPTKQKEKFAKEIHDVTFELTGSELIAALLEDAEIKQNWPEYNRSQKSRIQKYGIFVYDDQKGIPRLGINKVSNQFPFLKAFPSMSEARNWLFQMIEDFGLNPTYCGMSHFETEQVDDEQHVASMEEFMEGFNLGESSRVLIGSGRDKEEKSFVYIKEGSYKGYGFYGIDAAISTIEEVEQYLIPQRESAMVRSIVKSELLKENAHRFIINL